jgi:S1-C subfamily serine protease
MRFCVCLFIFVLSFLYPNPRLHAAENPAELRKSVVRISNAAQIPDYKTPWNPGGLSKGRGSGLIISGQRILTNAHVVSNSRFLTVERDGDPKPYPAKVAHIAHDCDLAVLEVQDASFFKGIPPLAFDGIPVIDSNVAVYGYPVGGDRLSVTRGVVSRVDFQLYSHSGIDSHLAIQIDAAINPGNSGGPVLQNGKVVGVAFQGYSGDVAQNVGYMIPVPVINRFLKDIEDGRYDRYVDLAVHYFPLINPAMRKAYGLKNDDRGVVVTQVIPQASSDGYLLPGDVLLTADGKNIASDGTVELNGERVEMPEMVERKFLGDTIKMNILRQGEEMTINIPLKPFVPYLIQGNSYDQQPRYITFGGLVFQPLSRNYINVFGASNFRVRYMFDQYVNEAIFLERPEIIMLSDVLADPTNTYLSGFRQSIVNSVNGKTIRTLQDLAAALDEPSERYVINLEGEGRPLVLDSKMIQEAQERIKKRYNIKADRYLGDS